MIPIISTRYKFYEINKKIWPSQNIEKNKDNNIEIHFIYRNNFAENLDFLREYYFLDDSGYKLVGTGPRLLTPNGEPINY